MNLDGIFVEKGRIRSDILPGRRITLNIPFWFQKRFLRDVFN